MYERLETKGERSCTDWPGRETEQEKIYQHVRVIKNENGNVMVNSKAVLKRWKGYFEKLMNKENNRDPRTEEAEVVNKDVNCVSRRSEECTEKDEKVKRLDQTSCQYKFGIKFLGMGKMGIKFLTRLFNEEVCLSQSIKKRGDAQCCGNYKGIKLMSYTMKVWERIYARKGNLR